jgi:uncharacterized damage-inducible protein DinB
MDARTVQDANGPASAPLLERLFAHMEWADEEVRSSLASNGRSEALELFAHLLGAEEVWLSRLEGRPARTTVWPSLSLAACGALARESARGFRTLLRRLAEGAVPPFCSYTNSAGAEFRSEAVDILAQVALHGAYHRGQISTLLRHAGAGPHPTDYIAFVRGAPAATRQG